MSAEVSIKSAQITPCLDVSYGKRNVDAYVEYSMSNHGADGGLFLDPYFKPAIESLNEKTVLDIGCGGATWCIYAAKEGGKVYGIDIQPEMIEAAIKKIQTMEIEKCVSLSIGNAASLSFNSNFFDREISICVACNLPIGIFEKSFDEISRTLKKDGIAVIGLPHSLDIVFTDGSSTTEKVHQHINKILAKLTDNPSQEIISEKLSELKEVLSATFHMKKKRLTLVTSENDLIEGEKIWRKLPIPIVPNCFHSQKAYLEAFQNSNLRMVKSEYPHFNSEEERASYNSTAPLGAQLGPEYTSNAPFSIHHLSKIEKNQPTPNC